MKLIATVSLTAMPPRGGSRKTGWLLDILPNEQAPPCHGSRSPKGRDWDSAKSNLRYTGLVAYALFISEEVREQLRSLPEELRRHLGYRIHLLQQDFTGDIKKLEGSRNHYRLRVGGYRILFRMDTNILEVYAVKQRKDAYE
jgi:mRNA interferase RelE/StbE